MVFFCPNPDPIVYNKVDLEYMFYVIKSQLTHDEIICTIQKRVMILRLKKEITIQNASTHLIYLYFDNLENLHFAIKSFYDL